MKNMQKFSRLILSLVLILAVSCKSNKTPEEESKDVTEPIVKEAIKSNISEAVYPLPTSFETIHMLNEIGASYILGISNPVKNIDRYFTDKRQALNLGIYSADLSYATVYQMKQETIQFLDVIKKLAEELNLSSVYNKETYNNIQDNIDNKDELVEILTNSYYDTYLKLNENEKGYLSTLVLAGSWVEGLYISTNISSNVYHNFDIVKVLLEQKKSLNKLWEIMEQDNEEPYIK